MSFYHVLSCVTLNPIKSAASKRGLTILVVSFGRDTYPRIFAREVVQKCFRFGQMIISRESLVIWLIYHFVRKNLLISYNGTVSCLGGNFGKSCACLYSISELNCIVMFCNMTGAAPYILVCTHF